MTAPRTHWSKGPRLPSGLYLPVCGYLTPQATTDPSAVTCKRCRGHLGSATSDDAAANALIAAAFVEPPTSAEESQALRLQSRQCHCGHCDGCREWTALKIAYYVSPHEQPRPRMGPREHRWSSVSQCLQWYVIIRHDGYGSVAAMGWAGTELINQPGTKREGLQGPDQGQRVDDHLRQCVAAVRPGGGGGGTPKATRDAEDAAEISRILENWARGVGHWLLSPSQLLRVLLARIAGSLVEIKGEARSEMTWQPVASTEIADRITAELRADDPDSPALSPKGVGSIVKSGSFDVYLALLSLRLVPRRVPRANRRSAETSTQTGVSGEPSDPRAVARPPTG